ncbi:MAG: TATA-box-binding protein [Methanomassiliicoccus sp.]|nr:TATA-box-binding protein [Methanomassiliicoccus sp.]
MENVVASATLGNELDLQALAMTLEKAEYEPEKFPGLIYRINDPKAALLLFKSGKVVCTGAKNSDQVHEAIGKLIKQLEKTGVTVADEPEIIVQNIVASANLGEELNLNAIAISFGLEQVEYEPEQFPGLVYRMNDPKIVILLFGSGRLVCTGGKTPKDIEVAVDKITAELRSNGLLR